MVVTRRIFILLALALGSVSCKRSPQLTKDAGDFALLETSLYALSFDLQPLLTNGMLTNINSLKIAYASVYSNRPPLFTISNINTGVLRDNERYLPAREYFCLRFWTLQDPPETPLFWSYFQLPNSVVEYLSIDGTERACSSNDFAGFMNSLSNRWDKINIPLR
jgi:hypothetical protein